MNTGVNEHTEMNESALLDHPSKMKSKITAS